MRVALLAITGLALAGCGAGTAPPSPAQRPLPAHVVGTVGLDGRPASVDLQLTDGGAWGTVSVGTMRVEGLRVGDSFYVRGRELIARFEPPETVACAGDRWVIPPAAAGLAGIASLFSSGGLEHAASPSLHWSGVPQIVLPVPDGAIDLSGDRSVCSPQTAGPGWSG